MSQPNQAETVFSHAEAASSRRTSALSPVPSSTHSPVRSGILKSLAAAGIVLGAAATGSLASGCGGESEEPYSFDGNTGTDSGTGGNDGDPCDNKCGTNTHCNPETKKCDPNTVTDPCENKCGTGTVCNPETHKCDPVTTGFAGVTWRNFNPESGKGWTDTMYGTDGPHPLGVTAWFSKSESPVADCFVAYGNGSILTMQGSGEWWDVEKPWLAVQTGHSLSDTAYFTSHQAAKDAAAELLTWRTVPPAYRPPNAFVWRAAGTDKSWQDHDPVTPSDSTIHCVNIPSDGVVEKY